MRLVAESPAPDDWPPHYVNSSAWLKSNASKWLDGVPEVGKAGPFLTEVPERFAPTWLPTVDQLSFWYNQGTMAMRAGRFDLAMQRGASLRALHGRTPHARREPAQRHAPSPHRRQGQI